MAKKQARVSTSSAITAPPPVPARRGLASSRPLQRGAAAALKPHDHFRKFLQDGQYRITGERFEVLDAVLAWNDHFDADNLFIYLKNHGSKVSRATVYKTLNLLHECGLVSRYRFSQGHAQYEKTTDRPHHDHMVCTKCGAIIEFENSRVERLQDDACAHYGFTPMYHSFQIFGICLDCRTTGSAARSTPANQTAIQPDLLQMGARPPSNGSPASFKWEPEQGITGIPGSGGVMPLGKSREHPGLLQMGAGLFDKIAH